MNYGAREVFRVQDREGRGPWRPGFSSKWVEERDDHANLLPWIHEMPTALNRVLTGFAVGCVLATTWRERRDAIERLEE